MVVLAPSRPAYWPRPATRRRSCPTAVGYAVLAALVGTGFTIVNPNNAQVVQFFGRTSRTIREAGFHWTLPLTARTR